MSLVLKTLYQMEMILFCGLAYVAIHKARVLDWQFAEFHKV